MNALETQRLIDRVASWEEGERLDAHTVLFDRPPLFDLELVSACNQRCAFCPRDTLRRRSRFMTQETFDAVVAFLPEDAVVMLSGMGEATLHPRLSQWVARLTARGVSACLITNGIRLTPALQDALVRAGIDEIQVSLHGLTESVVSNVVPRGAQPERVLAHVQHLARYRRTGLRVRINYVETAANRDERDRVARFAAENDFLFFWRRQHNRGGDVAGRPAGDLPPGCGIFASVTLITSDGDLLSCVNDVAGTNRLGTVRESTWLEVLAAKRALVARGDWFASCRTCNDDYRWVLLARGSLEENA